MVAAKTFDQSTVGTLLDQWEAVGRELLARGGVRLDAALAAARRYGLGGGDISTADEMRIAEWFADIVREAVVRGGSDAQLAIWMVLVTDEESGGPSFRELGPADRRVVEADGRNYDEAFVVAARGYVLEAIARANEYEVAGIRRVVDAGSRLDDWAPFNNESNADGCPDDDLSRVVASMANMRSNDEVAEIVRQFAYSTTDKVREIALTTPYRIGLIAWLAHRLKKPRARKVEVPAVAVANEERAA